MANLGTAYISVMPSMQGFGKAVESGLSGIDTSSAGNKLGQKAATGFAGGMAKSGAIMGVASSVTTKALDAVTSSIGRAVQRVDTMANFPKVMSNLGVEADKAESAINKISDGLTGLPTALDSGVSAVQRFTSFNGDVEKSADMFLAVNDAILAGGSGAQMQASALEQLSQAYTKGKMDTMEWRTLQQAMPAQLKQVAKSMGMTTEQLGAGLRQATKDANYLKNISMDEFIGEIMKLDKKGVNGLSSFSQQAKDATTGIDTAMANMNTAVVRGVANVINAFGQENISGAINYFSSKIGEVAKVFAEDAKEVSVFLNENRDTIKDVVDAAAEIAPTAIKAWGAFKLFKGGKAIFGDIFGGLGTLTGKLNTVGETLVKTGGKMEAVGLAGSGAMQGFGGALAGVTTGAVGLVAGTGIAIVALQAYNQHMNDAAYEAAGLTEEQQKTLDSVKQLSDSYTQVATKRDEQFASIESESAHLQALKEEYNGLIDSNGQVKQGYEDRAQVIIGELAESMGIEKDKVYELIDSYGLLGEAADQSLEKRKAQMLLEANEETYTQAIANQEKYAQALADAQKVQEEATSKSTQAQIDFQNAYQSNIDAFAATPEAISYGVYSYGQLGYAADGAADAAYDASKQVEEASNNYMNTVATVKNTEGLEAAIASNDNGKIEEWSTRLQNNIVAAEDGTRESLENQVANFQSSYDSIKSAVDNGAQGLEVSLENVKAALDISKEELANYNSIELNEKFAKITVNDGQVIDSQGRILKWNGTKLIDQKSKAEVKSAELVDAQKKVYVWNGSTLKPKKTSVNVNTSDFATAAKNWKDTSFPSKTTYIDVYRRVHNSSDGGDEGHEAAGGFFSLHASGGFITNGPMVLGRDRNGVTHVVGEDGREWVQRHADGTYSVVPIENRKYLAPYAMTIAQMLAPIIGTARGGITVNLAYDASADAEQMARDVARNVRLYRMAGAM